MEGIRAALLQLSQENAISTAMLALIRTTAIKQILEGEKRRSGDPPGGTKADARRMHADLIKVSVPMLVSMNMLALISTTTVKWTLKWLKNEQNQNKSRFTERVSRPARRRRRRVLVPLTQRRA